jgi:hypothetical protein
MPRKTTNPKLTIIPRGNHRGEEAYFQTFHPLRGESEQQFHQVLSSYAAVFQLSDPIARKLIYQLTVVHFDIDRAENAMARLSKEYYETDPEKWLKLHSGFVTQRNALHLAAQRLLATLDSYKGIDHDESIDTSSNSHSKRDSDGNRIEEYRFWNVYKFSELPEDNINEAMEVICYRDGSAEAGPSIPLREFMGGEFMKPEYGLGTQFRRMLRAFRHPLHHPFDPSRMID